MTGSKLIRLANEFSQKFKPRIEERVGVKLEDIPFLDINESPEMKDKNLHLNGKMIIKFLHHKGEVYTPLVYVDEQKYRFDFIKRYHIARSVVHEISHFVHHKIFDREIERLKQKLPYDSYEKVNSLDHIINERLKFIRARSFREGFAQYMSLDYLIGVYQFKNQLLNYMLIYERLRYSHAPDIIEPKNDHRQGYLFFKKVMRKIGDGRLLEVAVTPSLNREEIQNPELYIKRNYPQLL